MTDIEPVPREDAVEEVRDRWRSRTDAFGRVYYTVLSITEYTHYREIADTANCAANTAKKHLDRLAGMGLVLKSPSSSMARYQRNDAYFEWREASRIAEDFEESDIRDRIQELESQQEDFEDQFGSDNPATIHVFAEEDHDSIHLRMEQISKWQSVIRNIQLYQLAHRLAENDGHLISL